MKKFLSFIREMLVNVKIYMGRTMSWMGLINSLMLVFLVVERLNKIGVLKADLGYSIIFVVVFWFGLLVFLGWFEIQKVRAPHLETTKTLEFNPPMKEAYSRIKEIDDRTKMIEKWINNSQQKQVKQVPYEVNNNFTESKASPDNAGEEEKK